MSRRFKVGDLVQIRDEYEVQHNPSCFRIRQIARGKAVLGQLGTDDDDYHGADTEIDLDDPELIEPHPEILAMYSRHVH